MEAVKNINDFKRFVELNREKLYANAENADDIVLDDEWMQEDQWDDKKYAWKSIGELETDSNVMDKNDDIIAFVKTKCE